MSRIFTALGVAFVCAVSFGDTVPDLLCLMSDTYLESDGTQAIDTGCLVGPKTEIKADICYEADTSGSFTRYLFGVATGGSEFFYVENGDLLKIRDNTQILTLASDEKIAHSGVRYNIDLDLRNKKIVATAGANGPRVIDKVLSGLSSNSKGSFWIFTRNRGDDQRDRGLRLMRLYSLQVYEDGALVRDFIPYGYGSQTGLVDRCSGKVYTDIYNSPTPLKIGTDDPYVQGTCDRQSWVDTEYCLNANSKVEVDFAYSELSGDYEPVFGAGGGEGAWALLYANNSNPQRLTRGFADGDMPGDVFTRSDNVTISADGRRYSYVLDVPGQKETLTYGKTTLYDAGLLHPITKAASVPLGLFTYPKLGSDGKVAMNYKSGVKIFSFKVMENGRVVKDFVPRLVDGVAGFYDRANGKFYSSKTMCQLRWGGAIESVGDMGGASANGDACIISHASEVIDLGYYGKPNSRYELDFAWVDPGSARAYAFGSGGHGGFFKENGVNRLLYRANTAYGYGDPTPSVSSTEARQLCVLDYPRVKAKWLRGSSEMGSYAIPNRPAADDQTSMALFCRHEGSDYLNPSAIRLYSLCIYENDELKHRYYPETRNGVVGLRDLDTGDFHTKTSGSKDLEFVSGTYAGKRMFAVQPQGGQLDVGQSMVLEAFAPGALSYLWLRDGLVVEGATGPQLTVEWMRKAKYGHTYQCLALYSTFGYGVSDPAQVTSKPQGLCLILR